MQTLIIDRIPRPAWQIGLLWGNGEVEWNRPGSTAIAIVFTKEECDKELAYYNEHIISGGSMAVYRRIWISPARVASYGDFEGF